MTTARHRAVLSPRWGGTLLNFRSLCLLLLVAAMGFAARQPAAARDRHDRRDRRKHRSTRRSHMAKKSGPVVTIETPPDVSRLIHPGPVLAPAYILVDAESGRVLAQHNAHQRMFPASTTKTMTALVAIESGDLERRFAVGPNPVKIGESSLNLMQGEIFTLHELIGAALVKSANDSCVAIAEGVAGSVPAFVEMMNRRARELGAKDTHFVNPHGLHDPNHYTTAYDLSLIAREAMRDATFNSLVNTKQFAVHGNVKVGAQRVLINRNRLLFRWNECDGIKTGYTRQAGRCLIASATHTDNATGRPWRLLSVVLHAPDSWSDSYNLMNQAGFSKFRPTIVAKADEAMATGEVQGGGAVTAVPETDAMVPLLSSESGQVTTKPHLLRLQAPVSKGARVGNLVFLLHGEKVGYVPLVAQDDVPLSVAHQIGALATGRWWPAGLKLPAERRYVIFYGGVAGAVVFLLLWRRLRLNARARKKAAARRRNISNPPHQGAHQGRANAARERSAAPRQQTSAPRGQSNARRSR